MRRLALLLTIGVLVSVAACGDDAKDCEPPGLRCIENQAQVCSDGGLWETVLECEAGTSCSLAINTCLVERGQSPCCL